MKIVFLILIGFCSTNTLFAQSVGLKLKESKIVWKPNSNIAIKHVRLQPTQPVIKNNKSLAFVSPYKHADHLGFVCKWELKIDVKTKNPVRFRLGSYDYVNKLEGK